MVKGLVWVAILGSMVVAMYYGMVMMNADTGELVGMAIAPPENGQVELQVLAPLVMTKLDPPPLGFNGQPDWDTWMASHYVLKDSQGNTLTFKRIGFKTREISELQAGTAEFIMGCDLSEGETYSLEMIPIVAEPKKYLHTFTAEAQPFQRINFPPNY